MKSVRLDKPPPFLVPKGGISEGVAIPDAARAGPGIEPMQHRVRQRQAVRVLHVFHAEEGALVEPFLLRFDQFEHILLLADPVLRCPVPAVTNW